MSGGRHVLLLLPTVLLIILAGSLPQPSRILATQVTEEPHFIDQIIFLEQDTNNQAAPSVFPLISNTGRYAFLHVSRTNEFSEDIETAQYLWDFDQLDTTLSPDPTALLKIDASYTGPWVSFSPNDEWIALKSETLLQIRALPSLETVFSIELPDKEIALNTLPSGFNTGRLAWWSDGQSLAVLSDRQSLVWNSQTHQADFFPLDYSYDAIVATSTGWFMRSYEPDVFTLCSFEFAHCDTHEISTSQRSVVVQPSGQVILSWQGRYCGRDPVYVWRLHRAGNYELERETQDIPEPTNFSPNGQYLFYHPSCTFQYGIWDFENNSHIQNLEPYHIPFWLPDSKYFLTLSQIDTLTLNLYEIGSEGALDTLNLNQVSGLGSVDEWPSFEVLDIWNSSTDGRKILINLGHAAMVIEIGY